ISEGDIAQVQEGQEIRFTTLAEPNRAYQSKIDTVDPALTTLTDNNYTEESGNTEAIYYYANALVDNADNRLRIGMTVQGQVNIAKRENVLVVPTSTLKKKGDKTTIQVLNNNQVEEKEIQTGLSDSQYTEVISGINEGEQIVVTQRADSEKVSSEPRRRMF
ncbi:efflux RND transporter periplasmic adaptor subunit, partial [Actinobacillus minor]|uniref:efflux RND transporter periplasmic adaptor subunit n=1 Tax=Actinobacillus minor TaxID=51047 RepID=UPI0034E96789